MVSVTVITSPALKSVVGLKTTVVVPPPEKLPAIIPVFFPVIIMLSAIIVELSVEALKVKVMSEFKATLLETAVGLLEIKVKDWPITALEKRMSNNKTFFIN